MSKGDGGHAAHARPVDKIDRRANRIAAVVAAVMAFGSLATAVLVGCSVAQGVQEDLTTGKLYMTDANGGVDIVSEGRAVGHRASSHIEVPAGHGVAISAEGLTEGDLFVVLVSPDGGTAVIDRMFSADGEKVVTEDGIKPGRYLVNARTQGSTGIVTVRTYALDSETKTGGGGAGTPAGASAASVAVDGTPAASSPATEAAAATSTPAAEATTDESGEPAVDESYEE